MFNYFGPPEVGDPEILLSGAVKMFLSYPKEVVEAVCDPVSGLPAQSKWSPKLSEIRDALEIAWAPVKRHIEREKAIEAQLAERKLLEAPTKPRPTYEELQARCAAGGLHIGPKGSGPRMAPAAFKTKYGLTEEQWNAIPNAKGSA